MILESLAQYYELLNADPNTDIAPPNFSAAGVSFALALGESGEILSLIRLFDEIQRGKKTIEIPKMMFVPEQVKRSSGVLANFLCDSSPYVLGISDRDGSKPKYSQDRFAAFSKLNLAILDGLNSPAAKAVAGFLNSHDPATIRDNQFVAPILEEVLQGGRLVFTFEGDFVHEDPEAVEAWNGYKSEQDAELAQCLVTGDVAPISRLHPSLKNVYGANSTGATLVGFNADAYESYDRKQGSNSPVSREAVFAYATALNHLLSDQSGSPKFRLGDTTVVYWAESPDNSYRDVFAGLFDPTFIEELDEEEEVEDPAEERLRQIATKVKRGSALDVNSLMEGLDPKTRFYVLGLAPNAARISVRFFHTDAFEEFISRIMQHYKDMAIVKEFENQRTYLTVRDIVGETMSKKASNPQPTPLLAGAIFRSILTGAAYPSGLYSSILTRVRADQDDPQKHVSKIGYERAAIVKAYLVRKYRHQPEHAIQEVLQMSLNENSSNPAYLLGRLFAVLEKVQREAIPGLNATIKDRYFTSACATPASVFPVLLRLSQHHISKAEYGYVSERRIEEILDNLEIEENPIPSHLDLDEQGVFILGYYHQRAAFYRKRDEASEETEQVELATE